MSITSSEIIAAVRELAKQQPNFTYTIPKNRLRCVLVDGDEASCLIGHALVKVGFPVSRFEDCEDMGLYRLLTHLNVDSSNDDIVWLERAQGRQDEQFEWAFAVRYADRMEETVA